MALLATQKCSKVCQNDYFMTDITGKKSGSEVTKKITKTLSIFGVSSRVRNTHIKKISRMR